MSTTAALPPPSTTDSYLTNLGLGYSIAIALGFLVLLSTLLLSSYLCCRRRRQDPNPNSNDNGIILPRIIFVAEDDDDESNQNPVVGLDPMVINSYPKFPFSKDRDNGGGGGGGVSDCSICLCEYRDGEMLRMLPDCRHFFHLTCVDAWLKLNASCPVCRNSPLPTPLSTPLSEVVPLSQYSGGRRR
ncbi:RING-H2 finger protein ATL67-like [Actinidia eriantha]|uniref:RING-H2 finger protein ATL67-like n=1 Tax=Actinidia eriantha TaxID=165200 RepID=UPI00258F234D|nr:RING-H2 finger protein ATL67-like [Actinidia eriantha]